MLLTRHGFLWAFTTLVLAGLSSRVYPFDPVADMSALYRTQVDRQLDVPAVEVQRYAELATEALVMAGVSLVQPQYLAVVDRDPNTQAFFLFWRSAQGEFQWVGASPVSTGQPGSFDHFQTPLGVFDHTTANPDFRAEGTRNSNGIRGYGAKGMRVYDFGWQRVPKGWGDGAVSDMRLQMHATDPDLLERRLGSAQSKGCIRIPASLNRLLDHYGVLDADYELALRNGRPLWVLDAQREPVPHPGRYLIVVESGRAARPDWAPAPFLVHHKPALLPGRR
ncbi:MAG: murein L,D-transpeptidase [Burkholderiaceae bacterium]|nr:MAG: murein L,D-transpeptidase [Burkholderiaceae bacterium]